MMKNNSQIAVEDIPVPYGYIQESSVWIENWNTMSTALACTIVFTTGYLWMTRTSV